MPAPVGVVDRRYPHTFSGGGRMHEFIVADVNADMGETFALLIEEEQVTLSQFTSTNKV